MRGRAPLVVAVTLWALGAATPAAFGWGELAVHDVPDGRPATCLSAAGDGRLQLLQPTSRERWAFDLLASGPAGLTPVGRPYLPGADACPAVAGAGDVTVAASESYVGRGPATRVEAAVSRSGATRRFELGRSEADAGMAVAASARGDAVVAWPQSRGGRVRRVVVRRVTAAGTLGPLERLVRWRRGWDEPLVAVGMDANGTATVTWTRQQRDGYTAVDVAHAEPGEPLSRAQTIARDVDAPETLALAVAPSGRALLSFDGDSRVRLRERTTADGPFAPVRVPRPPRDVRASMALPRVLRAGSAMPALALRDDGGAVLAWRTTTDPLASDDGRVAVSTRAPGAGFARARLVDPRPGPKIGSVVQMLLISGGGPPFDHSGDLAPRVALGPDGRFALGWTRERRTPFGDEPIVAKAAFGALDGTLGSQATISCACRSVDAVAALIVDGEPAVAYTDNVSADFWLRRELPGGDGRLHLWTASRSAADRPPPSFAVGAPRTQRLRWRDPLVVRVRCSAACDVRGSVEGKEHRLRALGSTALAGPGSVRLRLWATFERPVVPAGSRRVRVAVRVAARNGRRLALRRLWVPAQRRPRPPLPRFRDARVVRRGDGALVVSWRYPARPRGVRFGVAGELRRRNANVPLRLQRYPEPNARHRYRVVLRPRPRDDLRGVLLTAYQSQTARIRRLLLPLP